MFLYRNTYLDINENGNEIGIRIGFGYNYLIGYWLYNRNCEYFILNNCQFVKIRVLL